MKLKGAYADLEEEDVESDVVNMPPAPHERVPDISPHYWRNRILVASLIIFTVTGLVLGNIANEKLGRKYGPYSLVSFACLVLFCIGGVSLFLNCFEKERPRTEYRLGLVYFFGMFILWVCMTISGIVYLATLRKKLEAYCSKLGFGCDDDSLDKAHNTILPLSLLLGIFFFFFFIFFLRIIYKWLNVLERVNNLTPEPPHKPSFLAKFLHTIGPNLPKFNAMFSYAITQMHKFFAKCCACGPGCQNVDEKSYELECGNTIPVIIIMTCCLSVGIFCFVVAAFPEKFGVGFQTFCFIWEIIVQWIAVIFNNVSSY